MGDLRRLLETNRSDALVAIEAAGLRVLPVVCRAVGVQPADAEDLVEGLVVDLYAGTPSWLRKAPDDASLDGWIETTLEHRARKLLGRGPKTGRYDFLRRIANAHPPPGATPEPDPVRSHRGVIARLLSGLPPRQRDVVRRRFEGDSIGKIALDTDVPKHTVQDVWRRASARLARLWRARKLETRRDVVPALPREVVRAMGEKRREIYRLCRRGVGVKVIAARLGWAVHSVTNEIVEIRKLAPPPKLR